MTDHGEAGLYADVNEVVEAFEFALARDGRAELGDFAPTIEHPNRLAILCELVRVDLEHQWESGRAPRLEAYRDGIPDLFADPSIVRGMAFEEYRLRLAAGESPTRRLPGPVRPGRGRLAPGACGLVRRRGAGADRVG